MSRTLRRLDDLAPPKPGPALAAATLMIDECMERALAPLKKEIADLRARLDAIPAPKDPLPLPAPVVNNAVTLPKDAVKVEVTAHAAPANPTPVSFDPTIVVERGEPVKHLRVSVSGKAGSRVVDIRRVE